MKLRLPHKFQAALVAALASVSFTTLSSGTIAVATGTALLAGQQAMAEELTGSDTWIVPRSNTEVDGTMLKLTSTSCDTGMMSKGAVSSNNVFAPNINVGNGAGTWTLTFTISNKTTSEVTLKDLLLDVSMFNSDGQAQNASTNREVIFTLAQGGTTVGECSTTLQGRGNVTQPSFIYNGTALTQDKPVLTFGEGVTLAASGEEGSSATFTLTAAHGPNASGQTGCFFGLLDMVASYTYQVSACVWSGGASQTWGDAEAWSGGAVPSASTPAVFNETGTSTTVNINSEAAANSVAVSGQDYTFNLSGDGASLTASAINVTDHSLTVSDAGKVAATYSVGAGASLILRGTASVGQGMSLGSGAHLVLGDGITVNNRPTVSGGTAILDIEDGATVGWSAAEYDSANGISQVNVGKNATLSVTSGGSQWDLFARMAASGTLEVTIKEGGKISSSRSLVGWAQGDHGLHTFNILAGATLEYTGGENYMSRSIINLSGGTLSLLNSNTQLMFERNSGNKIATTADATQMSRISGGGWIEMGHSADETSIDGYSGYEFNVVRGNFTIDGTNTADLQVNVPFKSTHALLKTGDGVMELTNANGNYAAAVNVHGGTLKLSGAGTPGTGTVNLNTGTTLQLSHAGAITLSNVVAGQGGITKDGTGTVTLSGANTYTGATLVSAGTLVASNASALGNGSAVAVAAGATLDLNTALTVGSLTLNGGDTPESGATLKFAASSPLTVTGALTLNSGSVLDVGNIDYSTGAITLATVGSISSLEGVTLRNVAGQYGAELEVVDSTTLMLKFGLPDELLVWDNYAGPGGWGSQEGLCNNWHDISSPDVHIVYPSGVAKDVRFTAEVQDTAILMEDIEVKTLNVDAGAAANVYTGGGSSTYGLTVDSVAGSGATLNLTGEGTATVTGTTHLGTLTVAAGTVNLADSTITTLTNNGGTVTVAGVSTITTLNATGGTTAIHGADADHKASVGTLNITSANASAEFTYTDFNFSNGDRSIKGNVTIGAGATGTVAGGSDGLNYDGTVTITVDGGTLVLNHRWTVGGNNQIVLKSGTVTGTGQSGASAFDPIGNNNFIVSTGTSSIAAPIRLRNAAVGIDVQDDTLTISGNMTETGGAQGLVKNGAGTLALTGTLSYTGNTVVNAGTLATGSTLSLTKADQLQVKSGATASLTGTVNIAKDATFSVASGGTLTFGGTVAVTGDADHEWAPEAGTNGFGMIGSTATVGTGATGGNWTLNGHAATYDTATGQVSWEAASTTYYIQVAGTQAASLVLDSATKLVVDTHDTTDAGVVALGGGQFTNISALEVRSGVVSTTRSGAGDGLIHGAITVEGGATFRIAGNNDALGYNSGVTSVTLNGTDADHLATLDLAMTKGSETMHPNLILNGNAIVTDSGKDHAGFNTFGGNITATGTNNVIEHMRLRNAVTVTVNSGADLVVNTLDNDVNSGDRNITKEGAGALTFTNSSATPNNLDLNGGTLTFGGGTTTVGGALSANSNASMLVVGTDAEHTATLSVNRLQFGNANAGTTTGMTINTGSTVKVTGNNTMVNYNNASLVLGRAAQASLNVQGTFIAENTHLLAGDGGYTMDINGGTVLAKGLKTNGAGNRTQNINISNNGKLILGDAGITTANAGATANISVDNGTIGVYNSTGLGVSIEKDIALSGNVTFDAQNYTVNGTAVERGTNGGNIRISGNLSGDATITKAGTGTLTLSGSNTITHTINLQEGWLVLGGNVTVDSASVGKFVKYGQGTEEYSDGVNGFLTSSAEYYLVQGSGEAEVDATGLQLTGGALIATQPSAKDLIFTFDTSTPSGLYYVNESMSYADDAESIATATGFVIKEGATLTIPTGTTVSNKVIYGAGTYSISDINGAKTLGTGVTLDAGWTGTVRVSGNSSDSWNAIYSNFANENSWVEFAGHTGFDNSWASSGTDSRWRDLDQNISLVDVGDNAAWNFTAGASSLYYMNATGLWKGNGTFKMSASNKQGVQFSNNISGWDGILETTSGEKRVRFTENATVVNAEIKGTGGTLAVEVETDVQFNKAITANSITVAADKTATLNADNNWSNTAFAGEGTLEIAGGKTLTYNSANYHAIFGKLKLDDGATLLFNNQNRTEDHTIGSITLADGATGTINLKDPMYNAKLNIGTLVGDSASTLNLWTMAKVSQATVYEMNGGEGSDFNGTIVLAQYQGGTRRIAMNINEGAATQLQNSIVKFSGSGDSSAQVGLGIHADNVTVKGIVSDTPNGNHYIFSGAASSGSSADLNTVGDDVDRTLTIATQEGDNFATRAKVGSHLSIVKEGKGSQAFNGDLSAMNGTVTASAGTLTLNNTGARGTLASVTYNGGTLVLNNMDVAGATTIGQGTTLDLGATNLTSAIVNQGTVNFTQNITASGLAKVGEDDTFRVGANDAKTTTNNYFKDGTRTESTIRVVNGGTVNPAGHTVTQDNVAYTLKTDGTATGVTADGVDYRVFYQGQAGSTVSVAQVAATAALHDTELLGVYSLGAYQAPTVLNVDQNVQTVMLGFATMNIGADVTFTGDLLIFGGMNTVSGRVGTEQLGFFAAQDSVTTFTDAPIQDGGVTFTSDQGAGGVMVQANKVADDDQHYYMYAIDDDHYAVVASELAKDGNGDATVANSLQVNRVHNSEDGVTGDLTLSAGVVAAALHEVEATSGNVEFLNMVAANGSASPDVSLNKLEIGDGKVVGFYEAAAPTSMEEMVAETSVTVVGTLTAGEGARLNANLEMAAGSHLDVSASGGVAGLIMGSTVTLNPRITLSEADMSTITGLGFMDSYDLFSDVEGFSYGEAAPSGDAIAFNSEQWVKASELFSNNFGEKDYYVFYSGTSAGGKGQNVGTIYVMQIPEPATSTLSLLALCALAARRRRKG